MGETGQTKQHIQDTVHTVTKKVQELKMESPLTYWIKEQKFQFAQDIKEDFKCPICKDILLKPLETVCEHYFCGVWFKQALQSYGFPLDCPVCRTELNSADHIKKPSRMVLGVIAELKVKCNDCLCKLTYEDHRNHLCRVIVGQADIAASTAADPPSVTLGQAINQLCQGEITPEMEQMETKVQTAVISSWKNSHA